MATSIAAGQSASQDRVSRVPQEIITLHSNFISKTTRTSSATQIVHHPTQSCNLPIA